MRRASEMCCGVLQVLLHAKADIDATNATGQTACDLAASEALRHAMQRQRVSQAGEVGLQTGLFGGGSYMSGKSTAKRRRVALVIGNDNYSGNMCPLQNCVHDAQDMAVALQKRGFMVMVVKDQTRPQMLACIRAFRQGVRQGDAVLLYFSGHGVELSLIHI